MSRDDRLQALCNFLVPLALLGLWWSAAAAAGGQHGSEQAGTGAGAPG